MPFRSSAAADRAPIGSIPGGETATFFFFRLFVFVRATSTTCKQRQPRCANDVHACIGFGSGAKTKEGEVWRKGLVGVRPAPSPRDVTATPSSSRLLFVFGKTDVQQTTVEKIDNERGLRPRSFASCHEAGVHACWTRCALSFDAEESAGLRLQLRQLGSTISA